MYQDCLIIDIVFVWIQVRRALECFFTGNIYIFFSGWKALKICSDSKKILWNFALVCLFEIFQDYSGFIRGQIYFSVHVERESLYHCEIMFNVMQCEYKHSYNHSNSWDYFCDYSTSRSINASCYPGSETGIHDAKIASETMKRQLNIRNPSTLNSPRLFFLQVSKLSVAISVKIEVSDKEI